MSTDPAIDTPPRPAREQNPYTELARIIRASGHLDRRYTYYATRITLLVTAFVGCWTIFFVVGDSWAQLAVAAALGILMTQFGFLGHDAAHQQVFRSPRANAVAARVLGGVFAGMSYGWWRSKHAKHHASPNREDHDPDIGPGALAFTASIAGRRQRGFVGWFTRHQGWLFFPLLTLEGLNLHLESMRALWRRSATWTERAESLLVVVRLAAYVTAAVVVLSPLLTVAFIAVQSAVFGLCLGASFAPSHKGMPIVPPEARIDFLRRQVLMSRNVRGSWLVDAAMGGLNYQIEHHLFPSMPRPNLRRAQPIVREYCAEHGVTYTETGLFESYGIVVDYLNNVGLRARGPFDCPLAEKLRT